MGGYESRSMRPEDAGDLLQTSEEIMSSLLSRVDDVGYFGARGGHYLIIVQRTFFGVWSPSNGISFGLCM